MIPCRAGPSAAQSYSGMRKLLIKIVLLLAVAVAAPGLTSAAPKGWEAVRVERSDTKSVVKDAEIEIKAAPGVIVVKSDHHVQIKIFTILGRLVNSETLAPGSMQFTVPAHGVYIVKVGGLTCKVAV